MNRSLLGHVPLPPLQMHCKDQRQGTALWRSPSARQCRHNVLQGLQGRIALPQQRSRWLPIPA